MGPAAGLVLELEVELMADWPAAMAATAATAATANIEGLPIRPGSLVRHGARYTEPS